MFDSDEFISIFLSEANEIVEGLENDLVLLEDNKSDEDLLNKDWAIETGLFYTLLSSNSHSGSDS